MGDLRLGDLAPTIRLSTELDVCAGAVLGARPGIALQVVWSPDMPEPDERDRTPGSSDGSSGAAVRQASDRARGGTSDGEQILANDLSGEREIFASRLPRP